MLKIYGVILEVLRELRPVVAAIELHDRDLARQLRRAATSVALNTSEGSGCSGGTRRERYRNALGSARVPRHVSIRRWRSATSTGIDASLLDKLDHVRAVLVKNVR